MNTAPTVTTAVSSCSIIRVTDVRGMRAQRAGRYGWPNGLNNQRRAGPVIAMTKKRKTRGKKRGSKEEPLIIDHAAVHAKKAQFDAAHEAGKKALKDHDFNGVQKAIARERDLIH